MQQWHPVEDSDQVVARIVDEPRIDPVASRQAGEEVYKIVPIAYIKIVGSNDTVAKRLDKPEGEQTIKRCWQAWLAYQGEAMPDDDGTPIEQLWKLPPEKAAHWRLQGIHTVEQVAGLSDSALDRLGMNARAFQRQAKKQVGDGVTSEQPSAPAGDTSPGKPKGRPRKHPEPAE